MSKFRMTLTALAVIAFTVLASSGANAQATRTWVSGVGDDVNPCSRTAPCKTYAGAISKTAVNGEISTLDPGGFGAVTITKSITIEGTQGQGYGSILHSGTTGVSIVFDNFTAAGETQKTVRLRNLNINGSGGSGGNASSGLRGVRITGTTATSANSEVYVEDCVLDGAFNNPGRGIEDNRTQGGLLNVTGTTIRNMSGTGISLVTAAASQPIKLIVVKSIVSNCLFGIASSTNSKATIYDTIIVNNTTGLFVEDVDGAGVGTTDMAVDHCVVSNNGTGFNASTGSSAIRVSNTTANANTTLFTTAGGGQVLSYGNNQANGAAFGGPVSPS